MFKTLSTLCLFAAAAAAQGSVNINLPTRDQTVVAGQTLTVQLARPLFPLVGRSVAVAIGVLACPQDACPSPFANLGDVLFSGLFNPEFHYEGDLVPYQNFTVTVPDSVPAGTASLGVAYFSLAQDGVGVSPETFEVIPKLTTTNQTIKIAH